MPFIALLALSALAGSPSATVLADEPFKPLVDCIAATRDCSKGVAIPIRAGVVDLAVMSATRDGKDGFYVFAPEDAYFHEFPPAPPKVETKAPPPPSFWNLYGVLTKFFYPPPPKPNPFVHYKLEAGLHETVYLTFKRDPSGAPVFESASGTAGPSGTTYLAGDGGECHADAAAKALLVQEALARVRSVYPTYQSAPEPPKDDVSNEYNIAGHDPIRAFFNREQCAKGLDPCLESADLKAVAADEQTKLKK